MKLVLHFLAERGGADDPGRDGEHIQHASVAFDKHGIITVEPTGIWVLVRQRSESLSVLRRKYAVTYSESNTSYIARGRPQKPSRKSLTAPRRRQITKPEAVRIVAVCRAEIVILKERAPSRFFLCDSAGRP